MALDVSYLQSLPQDQAYAYLQQYYAANPGEITEQNSNPYYADSGPSDVHYSAELGRQILVPGASSGSYVVSRANDGTIHVGQQLADSWYDKEVFGVPIGAFLPVAAAAAGAAFPAGGAAGGAGVTDAAAGGIVAGAEPAVYGIGAQGSLTPLQALQNAGYSVGNALNVATGQTPFSAAASGGSWVPAAADAVKKLGEKAGGSTIGALIGGALGLLGSGDRKAESGREPWGPAAEWMKQQIADGRALQDYYKQNPFNAIQRTAYENQLADANTFRQSLPGLLDLANTGIGSQYVRGQGMVRSSANAFAKPGGTMYGPIDWKSMSPYTSGLLK